MITSASRAPWPQDVAITDLTSTCPPHASLIRTAKIATIDRRLVTTIGHLSDQDRHAVTTSLKRQLGDALSL
jgi:mRNA interferase MazF